jgi:hypothetical protein
MSHEQWTFGVKPGQLDQLLSLGLDNPLNKPFGFLCWIINSLWIFLL